MKYTQYATMLDTKGKFLLNCRSCMARSAKEAAILLGVDVGYVDLYEHLRWN